MMHAVLVVGAGPVGLVTAAELARHGIRCRIIDALSEPSPYCRALGVTPRTLEVFEDIGILRETLDAGIWISGRRVAIGGSPAQDYADEVAGFPYAHATLSLPQPLIERILTAHLATFGIGIERSISLKALTQEDQTVTVQLESADGKMENAPFRYIVGCDGAHSVVRRAAGIDFAGETLPFAFMLGDVRMEGSLPPGYSFQSIRPAPKAAPDFFVAIPLPEPHRYRVSMLAPTEQSPTGEGTDHGLQIGQSAPSLAMLQTKADQLVGEPVRLSDLRWSSRFRISIRLANTYQAGNVFIAGDAAHIHPPTGGQGMNTGIQDAYNLAWKLALVLNGKSPASLLESYTHERRAEAENVIDRSVRASMNTGGTGFKTDRLADTQLLMSYRSSPWVAALTEENWTSRLQPGDRAPDCWGLRRAGVGYPIRLFDVLRGTTHVLLVDLRALTPDRLDKLESFSQRLRRTLGDEADVYLRLVVISPQAEVATAIAGIVLVQDPDGSFADTYGSTDGAGWLIRISVGVEQTTVITI